MNTPYEWLEKTQSHHWTISKLLSTPAGKSLNFLYFNENTWYDVYTKIEAKQFFNQGIHVRITRNAGIRANIEWLENNDNKIQINREFDIYINHNWYPLKDDHIADLHFSDLSPITRVGWDGPIILLDKCRSLCNSTYNSCII